VTRGEIEKGERGGESGIVWITRHENEPASRRAKKQVVKGKRSEKMRMDEFVTMRERVHVVMESTRRETTVSDEII